MRSEVNTIMLKPDTLVSSHFSKILAVNSKKEAETFGAFIRRVRNDKDLSTTQVSERAKKAGFKISAAYITKIENEPNVHPSYPKLQALAAGLGISEEEIIQAVGGKLAPMSPTDFYSALQAFGVEEFQAYGGVEKLTDEDRQEIIAMISTMVEQKLIRRQKAGGQSSKKR